GWLPITAERSRDWFAGSLALAVIVSFAIRSEYERRFGYVRPLPDRSGIVSLTTGLIGFMLASWMQDWFKWTFSAPALFVGVAFAYVGLARGRIRKHYLAIGAAWFLFASLSGIGVPLYVRQIVFELVLGGGLIVAGIGDHLLLQHTLQ